MDQKNISISNTKKEIWESYQIILKEMEEKKQTMKKQESTTTMSNDLESEEQKILAQTTGLNADKVINDLNTVKASLNNLVNQLTDKLVMELKKLDLVRQAIVLENNQLENIYHLKVEADSLLNLIALREQKKQEFIKAIADEEAQLKNEIEQKKKYQAREEEEYNYQLKLKRQKEQSDYEFRKHLIEREFNEKLELKEKELKLRENKMIEQEAEIKIMRLKIESLPSELEKVKNETIKQIEKKTIEERKIENELRTKDEIREREITKLKISSFEDIIKKQTVQINSLESQLTIASQKTQQLAIKIIEAGRKESDDKNSINN